MKFLSLFVSILVARLISGIVIAIIKSAAEPEGSGGTGLAFLEAVIAFVTFCVTYNLMQIALSKLRKKAKASSAVVIDKTPQKQPVTESIYLYINDSQTGPFEYDQILSMWNSGQITSDYIYWHEGMTEWQPIKTLLSNLKNLTKEL